MNERFDARPRAALPALVALAAATLGLLTACGGEETALTADDRARAATAMVVSPLLDDQGELTPGDPAAQPSDPGARTRAQRYATAAQAQQLEATLGDRVLRTEVQGSDVGAADLAVLMVWGQQAALDLPMDTPVLVRGGDLRSAASVADRLTDAGMSRVFLVTGGGTTP